MSRFSRFLTFAVIAVLSFGVLACGDDDTDAGDVGTAVGDAGEARGELCDDVGELDSAVEEASQLDRDSTVEEARDVKANIQDALDTVRESASGLAAAAVTVLQTAFEALSDAIDNLSGDDTLGTAAAGIASQAEAVSGALSSLQSQANCG